MHIPGHPGLVARAACWRCTYGGEARHGYRSGTEIASLLAAVDRDHRAGSLA